MTSCNWLLWVLQLVVPRFGSTDEVERYNMTGRLVGTEVKVNTVFLWYESPTGGESDSQIGQIVCRDIRQAVEVEREHRSRWDLPEVDRRAELEVYLEESLKA